MRIPLDDYRVVSLEPVEIAIEKDIKFLGDLVRQGRGGKRWPRKHVLVSYRGYGTKRRKFKFKMLLDKGDIVIGQCTDKVRLQAFLVRERRRQSGYLNV
jgi:hypothetical protein